MVQGRDGPTERISPPDRRDMIGYGGPSTARLCTTQELEEVIPALSRATKAERVHRGKQAAETSGRYM